MKSQIMTRVSFKHNEQCISALEINTIFSQNHLEQQNFLQNYFDAIKHKEKPEKISEMKNYQQAIQDQIKTNNNLSIFAISFSLRLQLEINQLHQDQEQIQCSIKALENIYSDQKYKQVFIQEFFNQLNNEKQKQIDFLLKCLNSLIKNLIQSLPNEQNFQIALELFIFQLYDNVQENNCEVSKVYLKYFMKSVNDFFENDYKIQLISLISQIYPKQDKIYLSYISQPVLLELSSKNKGLHYKIVKSLVRIFQDLFNFDNTADQIQIITELTPFLELIKKDAQQFIQNSLNKLKNNYFTKEFSKYLKQQLKTLLHLHHLNQPLDQDQIKKQLFELLSLTQQTQYESIHLQTLQCIISMFIQKQQNCQYEDLYKVNYHLLQNSSLKSQFLQCQILGIFIISGFFPYSVLEPDQADLLEDFCQNRVKFQFASLINGGNEIICNLALKALAMFANCEDFDDISFLFDDQKVLEKFESFCLEEKQENQQDLQVTIVQKSKTYEQIYQTYIQNELIFSKLQDIKKQIKLPQVDKLIAKNMLFELLNEID